MTVVVLGEKGVGKTTFIENCFVSQIHTHMHTHTHTHTHKTTHKLEESFEL